MNLTKSQLKNSSILLQELPWTSPPEVSPPRRNLISQAERTLASVLLRVSDNSQVDTFSLAAQERAYLELCKSKGWVPVHAYREEGISAHTDSISKRPVFRQLLEDAAAGKFHVVVVHTLDRWARNLQVMLETLAMLGRYNVGFVSITENLDYTTPHGKLTIQFLGGMAEFSSEMLSVHTKKGIEERARQGKLLGSIPFGYEPCWEEKDGERVLRCKPEHPGGIHIHSTEGPAVQELFRKYATGTTTLSQLAGWLKDQGFRTRNRHKLQDAKGKLVAEPRLFTTASLRGILRNPIFIGKVRHKKKLHQGLHEPLVSQDVFEAVQLAMKKNSGRSKTLNPRPAREYLLKGLIHCAYCLMPMWAQTYKNGNRYYREHRGSRGAGACVKKSSSIPCHVPDDQISKIMKAIILPDAWLDRVLAKIQLAEEVDRVEHEKKNIESRLARLGQVYTDDLIEYEDYRRQVRQMEDRLSTLVVPGLDAAEQAGKLLENLPDMWTKSNLSERRQILTTMLDAVYMECKEEKSIVGIRPKPAFRPLFEIATMRTGSGVHLIYSVDTEERGASSRVEDATETDLCLWWRRGRVELYREHGIEVLLAA